MFTSWTETNGNTMHYWFKSQYQGNPGRKKKKSLEESFWANGLFATIFGAFGTRGASFLHSGQDQDSGPGWGGDRFLMFLVVLLQRSAHVQSLLHTCIATKHAPLGVPWHPVNYSIGAHLSGI